MEETDQKDSQNVGSLSGGTVTYKRDSDPWLSWHWTIRMPMQFEATALTAIGAGSAVKAVKKLLEKFGGKE